MQPVVPPEYLFPHDLELPPGEDDLPYEDGVPLESDRHVIQLDVLRNTLRLAWLDRPDRYVAGNMFIYFQIEQTQGRYFRGPDVYVAMNAVNRERKSWVVWREGKAPDVVIELLSDSTARFDRGEKKRIYEQNLRVPEYFWYDPFTAEFAGWRLVGGVYEPLQPDEHGRIASHQAGLLLAPWDGTVLGITARWLRWALPDGTLLPLREEVADAERHNAFAAREEAEQARQRATQAEERAADAELQAERERQRTANAEHLAEQERQRAHELERRIAELEARPRNERGERD